MIISALTFHISSCLMILPLLFCEEKALLEGVATVNELL